ncbi:MAG: hypothetical protein PHY88_00460 [Candidatus Omnitrophica bacterium]|nr:hypothetical protein [Candidatus Omnitrophota bacterium]
MILPDKHIKLSNSILNVGALLLKYIGEGKTVSSLWDESRRSPEIKTFDKFSLGCDLLFIFGLIEFKDGLLKKAER